MNLTANEPFDPLNAAAGKAGNTQHATGAQLFRDPNGRAVTGATDCQIGANGSPFESAHQAVPFVPYPSGPYSTARLSGQTSEDQVPMLRLVPSQQQSDFDSPAVLRSLVDQSAATSAAPSSSADMSDLLKLRSIIQAVGSRGLFPIQ